MTDMIRDSLGLAAILGFAGIVFWRLADAWLFYMEALP